MKNCSNCLHNEVCEARINNSDSCNYGDKDRWVGWISKDEELPNKNEVVLIKLDNTKHRYSSYVDAVIYESPTEWHLLNAGGGFYEDDVTEWMRFPD